MSYYTNNTHPTVFLEDEQGNEVEVALPTRWEVCGRCDGAGAVALPGQSFTSEEMWEMGEEFLEDYLSGRYDEPCPSCGGRTTVAVVDEARLAPDVLASWERQEDERWQMRAEREAERRMGC